MSSVYRLRASDVLVDVPLESKDLGGLRPHLRPLALGPLLSSQIRAQDILRGRRVWSVNSTAIGGGVAEMSRTLLPYWRGAGIDVRWVVIRGPDDFFRVTKRLHNHLHGHPGDGHPLGAAEFALMGRLADVQAEILSARVRPGDIVQLQDPQTACLVHRLQKAGAVVIWRCHIGTERRNALVDHAWGWLLPQVQSADALVFTRAGFVPPALHARGVRIITPAIDPASVKNQLLAPGLAHAITQRIGVLDGRPSAMPITLPRTEGPPIRLTGRAEVFSAGSLPRGGEDRIAVSLCRWDRLKDQAGIIRSFAEHVLPRADAHLIVAGPAIGAVEDDPEGQDVFEEVRTAWEHLPPAQRRRVHLACLPMNSLDENAAMVNALQTQADVIVKKSIEEGFGLGVTEALWKERPVVATRVGGHRDQIHNRRHGLLVDDPSDPEAFAVAIVELLENPKLGAALGGAGRKRVQARFLADRHLASWTKLFEDLVRGQRSEAPPAGNADLRSPVQAT